MPHRSIKRVFSIIMREYVSPMHLINKNGVHQAAATCRRAGIPQRSISSEPNGRFKKKRLSFRLHVANEDIGKIAYGDVPTPIRSSVTIHPCIYIASHTPSGTMSITWAHKSTDLLARAGERATSRIGKDTVQDMKACTHRTTQ